MDWKLEGLDNDEKVYIGIIALFLWCVFMVIKTLTDFKINIIIDILSLILVGYLIALRVSYFKNK
jgi:uncharacterized membrane-anchored protein